MTHILPPDKLVEIQELLWKAAVANADNPLGYRVLDALMAEVDQLAADAWVAELSNLCRKYWQRPIPEKDILERIAQLTTVAARPNGDGK